MLNSRRAAALLVLSGGAIALPAVADDAPTFHLSAGPAAFAQPSFPGASSLRTIYFPFLDGDYADRVYTSAADLAGVYAYKTEQTQIGAALELDPTRRRAADAARLQGLPDVKDTARAKLFVSHTVSFVTLEQNLATDVLGRGQGSLAQTNLWLTAPLTSSFTVNVGPGVTWADARYMHSFFAVDAAQAARNALLTVHATHAGLVDAHLNGLAEWQVLTHYRIGLSAYAARLRGDASSSPVVSQHVQLTLLGWLAYRFR